MSSWSALVIRARAAPAGLACVRRLDAFLAVAAWAALLADPLLLHKVSRLTPAVAALAAGAALPLLARTRRPLGALAAEVPLLLASLAAYHPNRAAAGIVMLLVFTVGLEGGRVRSLVVGAVMATVVVAAVFFTSQRAEPVEVVAYTALVLAALVAGEALRARQALQRTLVEEAARASGAAAQHRFDTERLALAHELHDVVGHTLVAVNVRAAAAARRARKAGGGELAALEEIASVSSAALSELRATLKALRGAQDGPVPLNPVQGLADLGALVAGVEEAGLSVDLEVGSVPAGLPAPVGHAVYRIIQEGLTNVLRHSAVRQARVRVTAGDGTVLVEVFDEGAQHPPAVPAAGHGLQGMRERAAALGGSCEAGPVNGAAWRVRAEIPVRRAAGGPAWGET
ncbi:MAG TPA: histidine kinase [Trebonia sp.]